MVGQVKVDIDPEFKALIPPLSKEERDGLEADIVRDGRAIVPLVVWRGLLVDGHNRYEICQKHKLPFITIEAPPVIVDRVTAEIWILETSLNRRNIPVLTRIEVTAKLTSKYEELAKQRQLASRAKPGEKIGERAKAKQNSAEPTKPPHERQSRAELAAKAQVSHPTFKAGLTILQKGVPELREAVRVGDIAISTAAELTALPAEKQREVASAGAKAAREASKVLKDQKAVQKLSEKRALAAELNARPLPAPEGPYRVIVMDPPWRYDKRADDPTHRGRNQYPDMTQEQILALPVPKLADTNCVLWLWTTNAFMHDAYHCLEAWGFTPKTILTWVKDRMGTGDWLRGRTEHCILAVRGRPIVTLTNQTTVLEAKLREHSRKPDEFYALVEALCPGTKLEMFAREPRDAWAAWGAEVEKFCA